MKTILIVGGITFWRADNFCMMVILMDGAMLYVYYMNYGSSINAENSRQERNK